VLSEVLIEASKPTARRAGVVALSGASRACCAQAGSSARVQSNRCAFMRERRKTVEPRARYDAPRVASRASSPEVAAFDVRAELSCIRRRGCAASDARRVQVQAGATQQPPYDA